MSQVAVLQPSSQAESECWEFERWQRLLGLFGHDVFPAGLCTVFRPRCPLFLLADAPQTCLVALGNGISGLGSLGEAGGL